MVGEGEGKSVKISIHPGKGFNGKYKVQEGLINGRPWYQNDKNRYLYFYDRADIETLSAISDERRIQNWNLDHRKPDGVSNWYSGGWSDSTEGLPDPEAVYTYWYAHFR